MRDIYSILIYVINMTFLQYTNSIIGDDLRQDLCIQALFRLFNELWVISNMDCKPFIYTYQVIPLNSNFGMIEFVKGCSSVMEFTWYVKNSQ